MENLSRMFPKDLVSCFSLKDNLYISCLISYFSFGELVSSLISSLIINYIVAPWIEKKLKTQQQFLSFLLTFLITYLLEKLFPRYVSILLSFICRFAGKSLGKSLMKIAHLVLNNLERIIFFIFPSFLEESELGQSLFISYLKSIAFVLFCIITIKTVMISDPTRLIGLYLLLTDRSKSEMQTFTTDVVTVTMDKNEMAFIMERIGMGEDKGTTNEVEAVIEDCICMGCDEFSALFRENEPCLDEVKEAFSVFDQNRDGFFDARDLQRVLIALRMGEGTDLDACTLMVEQYDWNRDGKIDSSDFCRLLERSLF